MTAYAVVDTNVLVSSLLTSNSESPTVRIIELIREQKLIPLYSEYLLSEYREVLRRGKFALPVDVCEEIVTLFTRYGGISNHPVLILIFPIPMMHLFF